MNGALRSELATRGMSPACVDTIELVRDVLARVGDRWTILILTNLTQTPLRFTELHERIPGISQRMLSHTLRALTRDGLVNRTAYAEVPPRVEYTLSPLGHSLAQAVDVVVRWTRDHQGDLVRNRAAFDGGRRSPEVGTARTRT